MAAWILLAACGQSAEPDAPAQGEDAEVIDTSPPACQSHRLPREIELEFDGDIRRVFLAGPTELPSVPLPLILNFHGYSDGAAFQEQLSMMSPHASERSYVVAYPEGTGAIKGWNGGSCCGTAVSAAKKDVDFTAQLIAEIAGMACIDSDRIYAIGYSNGGFLSHRLACELSETISGIASVAGVIGVEDCEPTRAIPVLQLHGTADLVVPYAGSLALGFRSVTQTMTQWGQRLHCDGRDPEVFYESGDARCVRHRGCDAALALCTLEDGGHTWPGGASLVGRGKTSVDLDANAFIVDFFEDARRP